MIEKGRYEVLKEKYGDVSSWAIWKRPDENYPKSNTDDMTIFDDRNLLEVLNPQYVFVGLNGSSTHGEHREAGKRQWLNFHSGYQHQNDYKLRYALMDTPFWGAYITDIIKHYAEVDSGKVEIYLRHHPEVVEENIEDFVKEISLLGVETPTLVAMGDAAFEILNSNLAGKYKILKIKHYSYRIGKENYRKEVLCKLNEERKLDTKIRTK